MTEDAWLTSNDPSAMLAFLGDHADKQRLRLFHCRCCRRIWHLIADERGRQAVEAAERFAQGKFTMDQLREYRPFVRAAVCHAKTEEWIAEAEANFDYTPAYCVKSARLFALCAAEATLSEDIANAHGGWESWQEPEMINPPHYIDPPRGSHYWAAAAVGDTRHGQALAGSRLDESFPTATIVWSDWLNEHLEQTGKHWTRYQFQMQARAAAALAKDAEAAEQAKMLREIFGSPFVR